MANLYVSSVKYAALTAWAAGTVFTLGQYVRQLATPAVNSERVFKATSISGTGTSGAAEPSWNLTAGATTTDNAGANQIIWTEVTGKESEQVSGTWKAPAARLAAMPSGRIASNDAIYVSNTHAETQTTALTVSPVNGNIRIICVTESTASIPPVQGDITTGATVSTTGASTITIGSGTVNNDWYIEGATFQAGSGANNAGIIFSGGTVSTGKFFLKNVGLSITNTGTTTASSISFGLNTANPGAIRVVLVNPTISFADAAQKVFFGCAHVDWRGGQFAGTAPTLAFSGTSSVVVMSTIRLRGVDLSTITGALLGGTALTEWRIQFENCKVNSAVTFASNSTAVLYPGSAAWARFDNCDDTASNTNYRTAWYFAGGSSLSDTTVVRTNGASDGVTAISMKTVVANGTAVAPFEWPAFGRRCNTTGSPLTATVEFIANSAAALTSAQIWMEVEALTDAASPMSTFTDDRATGILATGSVQPSSTAAWDTGATARANSHAYILGDIIKVATNPGRVFFCTVAGTSAGSEPAGYASAVDGGTVSDGGGGGATFRAGFRQKLNVTFTPQKQGNVMGTIKIGDNPLTLWIDRKMSLAA